MDSGYHVKVTGVMKDIPENSSVKADLFVSMSTMNRLRDSLDYRWGNFNVYSYLLLKPGADADGLQAKLKSFIDRHHGKTLKAQQEDNVLSLEKMKDLYWSSRGGFVSGSRSNVYIFSIVGLFILLIACINFINLATAQAVSNSIWEAVIGKSWPPRLSRQLGSSVCLCSDCSDMIRRAVTANISANWWIVPFERDVKFGAERLVLSI